MNKILALLVVLVLSMPVGLASADVASDLKGGLNLTDLFTSAVADGKTVAEVVMELIALAPDKAMEFVVAAISYAPAQQVEIQQAAILAGADPTAVMAASAAGLASSMPSAYGAAAKVPSGGSGHGGLLPQGVGIPVGSGNSVSPS